MACNRSFLQLLSILTVCAAGCTLEDPNPGTYCGDDQHPLAYIDYNQGICSVEKCTSENSCCGITDFTLRSMIYKAFRDGKCPANTVISECAADGEVYKCYPGCGYGSTYCEGICLEPGANANSYCDSETEKLACQTNHANCNDTISDGCEASLLNDNNNCGKCKNQCKTGEVCNDGKCKVNECAEKAPDKPVQCSAGGQIKCIDTTSDNEHCGECNHNCNDARPNHAKSLGCVSGGCQYACEQGFVQISVDSDEHIECVNPNSNDHCGATSSENKGKDCSFLQLTCIGGECIQNTCTGVELACKINGITECINVKDTDAEHCGNCNYRCSEHLPDNATSNGCLNGTCHYVCIPGYGNVGTDDTKDLIKCINPLTDNMHCGANGSSKGTTCLDGTMCVNGQCMANNCAPEELKCGEDDCRRIDADNCGACNYKCADHIPDNADFLTCSDNQCHYQCKSGFINIGLDDAQNIQCVDPTSKEYCGAQSAADPGKSCNYDQKCEQNECIAVCSGQTYCSRTDGTYLCVDTQSDKEHCGRCSQSCNTGEYCLSGECKKEWICDQTTCDLQNETKVCVDLNTNVSHCGRCGLACDVSQYQNVKEMECKAGNCAIKSCTKGYMLEGTECIEETCTNSGYTLMQNAYQSDGTTKPTRAYCIKAKKDLLDVAKAINEGKPYPADNIDNAYILLDDITISDTQWTPISANLTHPFNGVFNGDGHTIQSFSSFSINTEHAGLFGYVKNASIYNLTLTLNMDATNHSNVGGIVGTANNSYIADVTVKDSMIGNGTTNVGGVVGHADHSKLKNVRSENNTIINCSSHCGGIVGTSTQSEISDSAVSGNFKIKGIDSSGSNYGGFVGKSKSSVFNRCSTADGSFSIAGTYGGGFVGSSEDSSYTKSYSLISSSIAHKIGGFVGKSGTNDKYTECYSSGAVSTSDVCGGFVAEAAGGTFKQCASYGSVASSLNNGGFAGLVSGETHFEDCYSTASVSGTRACGGFVGEIQSAAKFIRSYAFGDIKCGFPNESGGFAGIATTTSTATISNSYFNKDISISASSPDGIGPEYATGGHISALPIGYNIINSKAMVGSSSLATALGSPYQDATCTINKESYTIPVIRSVVPESLKCK